MLPKLRGLFKKSKGSKRPHLQGPPVPRNESGGMFNNPSNFVVNNSPMISDSQVIIQNIEDGTTVLVSLKEGIMPGAGLDSAARYPQPKCYQGTRTTLINTIQEWLDNEQRERDMLWLRGPAGAGKSAVAQTIGEYCQEKGRLGAAFFFSRPNKRNDPNRVIPTLAYQIAVQVPEYKALVGRQLAGDPALMEKTRRTQFKKLIMEPLAMIKPKKKLLIVLDGLDECEGEAEQRELVELVNGAVISNTRLPVLWMICSRPESHLNSLFARVHEPICYWREELPINGEESTKDVDLYLRDSLNRIGEEYRDDLVADPWPPEEYVSAIALAASGLFIFVETLIRFIGDSKYANPERQLETVIKGLKRTRDIGTRDPMEALDLLYTQIMSEIPEDILPTTLLILGFFIYYQPHRHYNEIPAIHAASLMDLTRLDFHRALRKLHSVMVIPNPQRATFSALEVYHASFTDYLQNPARSGKFSPDPQAISCVVLRNHIKKAQISCNGGDILEFMWSIRDKTVENALAFWLRLRDWFRTFAEHGSLFREYDEPFFRKYPEMSDLFDLVRCTCAQDVCINPHRTVTHLRSGREYVTFMRYVAWLDTAKSCRERLPNFVRVTGMSESENECLTACMSTYENVIPWDSADSDNICTGPVNPARYVYVGYEERARLIVIEGDNMISHCMRTHKNIMWGFRDRKPFFTYTGR